LGRIEVREERTREVRNHNLISIVGREENVDRRFGLEGFTDSKIGKKGSKQLTKSLKHGVEKGVGPWS
jgi:hypothetical protein